MAIILGSTGSYTVPPMVVTKSSSSAHARQYLATVFLLNARLNNVATLASSSGGEVCGGAAEVWRPLVAPLRLPHQGLEGRRFNGSVEADVPSRCVA